MPTGIYKRVKNKMNNEQFCFYSPNLQHWEIKYDRFNLWSRLSHSLKRQRAKKRTVYITMFQLFFMPSVFSRKWQTHRRFASSIPAMSVHNSIIFFWRSSLSFARLNRLTIRTASSATCKRTPSSSSTSLIFRRFQTYIVWKASVFISISYFEEIHILIPVRTLKPSW